MAYEKRNGDGRMGPNDYKTEAKHPDIRGTFELDGQKYKLAAWEKRGDRGPWWSINVQKDDGSTFQGKGRSRGMTAEEAEREVDAKFGSGSYHQGRPGTKYPPPKQKAPEAEEGFSDEIPFAWATLIPLGGLLAYAAQNLLQVSGV